jgi:hypothetical protein
MSGTYDYINAVLDANPTVTRLVLTPATYAVATAPVPDGQQAIPTRVTVEAGTQTDETEYGYDTAGTVVVLFRC